MKVETSTGNATIETSSFLFMGHPGIGKTTLWAGFPNVLGIITSKKEVRRVKVPHITISDWGECEAAVDYFIDSNKYLIGSLDLINVIYDYAIDESLLKFKIKHQSDIKFGKAYDYGKGLFRGVVNKLVSSNKGIIFICHTTEREILKDTGMVIKTVPLLNKHAKEILLPLINEIGYINFNDVKRKEKDKEGKTVWETKRYITFEPSEFVEAKDRDGYLPSHIPLSKDPVKTFNLMKSFYEGERNKEDY